MIDLRSQVRRRLLAYYFTNPTARHYLRELAGFLGVDPKNLLRELRRLERQQLFVSEKRGREVYFRLNRGYPLYREVQGIVLKTVGAPNLIRDALEQIPRIRAACLYGSFARNQQDAASDIDLLIVGNPHPEALATSVQRLEKQLGREINYTLLSPEDYRSRQARKDAFLADVWRRERITLVGPR
ncbi:MAG: nucleotidyltransferase domain-containing protein [Acidobacteriia bacterium]|jgi:predicted nucleotidyltransferase|nr:nucleotidyltransferase domain-containing protein [Terriglobia bacterium]